HDVGGQAEARLLVQLDDGDDVRGRHVGVVPVAVHREGEHGAPAADRLGGGVGPAAPAGAGRRVLPPAAPPAALDEQLPLRAAGPVRAVDVGERWQHAGRRHRRMSIRYCPMTTADAPALAADVTAWIESVT